MRHLWSFLTGIVVAPLTWVLLTLGQDGSSRTVDRWVELGTFTTANLIGPAVYLAVAGILLGLLGTLRVSPLGPLVAGLLLVAPYVKLVFDPFALREAIPGDLRILGDPLPLFLPVQNGTLFLIGTLLLIATFSRQRWRRWPARATASVPAPASSPVSTDDEEPARPDWSALNAETYDPDTAPPTLGYPDADTTSPLPRREGNTSPWSSPPRGTTRTDTE
ncbi:hypothetical protein GCM10027280_56570 [Micromonospora polyrhachis]|uniref:Uncharacterized protein n=1 Tax=Micromonospora polyrhachis TaxID=1282883 RepID=A0A7W7WNL6_9ACTN|nr:hypothetical protein [Micromonospora polyrhachis]MBB4957995.1 hypothetical protein [Micromonospora polyrhachis]